MTDAETWHKPEDCLHITALEAVCAEGHLWCVACDDACPECGERPDWRPRREYLEAAVSAFLSVLGHRNPARANACDGRCSVEDVLAVGNAVVEKETDEDLTDYERGLRAAYGAAAQFLREKFSEPGTRQAARVFEECAENVEQQRGTLLAMAAESVRENALDE